MTITLELRADEADVLQEMAQTAETTIEAVLHTLIAQVPLSRRAEDGGAEAPTETSEAVTETAEAVAERRREQEEVEANIRRWHEERTVL